METPANEYPIVGKIVISGGPGFGKTSLVEELEKRGYSCAHEISRAIIREQLQLGSDILPWANLEAFSHLLFEGRVHQYQSQTNGGAVFFDRGIHDILAYMKLDNLMVPEEFTKAAQESSYHPIVFLTPPWEEIFRNDAERMESFEQAKRIHAEIEKTYREFGYQTREIPKTGVAERVSWMLNELLAEKPLTAKA